MAPSQHTLNKMLDILNANDEYKRNENDRLDSFSAKHMDRMNGIDDITVDTRASCFTFTNAWETPLANDLNTLKLLKTSLKTDVDRANLEHAFQYFDVIVNDFPGEYFLQSPYIFAVRISIYITPENVKRKCCLV